LSGALCDPPVPFEVERRALEETLGARVKE
jgi:hypothetical protein